jgi:hypothetical protein
VATVQVDTSGRAIRRLGLGLLAANLVFTAGTALFIREWGHREWHGPAGQWLIDRVLVQFHLATENVVAAWYSSMLLLTAALASALAFALEKKGTVTVFREKRGQSPFSAKKGDSHLFLYGWLGLAAAFAGLSLDELGSLHERLGMLHRAGGSAHGWVYVLGIPILGVAAFMAAFAWVRLRKVPAALWLFVAGIALFLSDPVFELFEMALLRAGRGNDLVIHNALLVFEEGIVELGGALCFLLGVLIYIRRTAGDGPHVFELSTRALPWIACVGLLMTAAVPGAHWFVAQLPPGDTGIPDNWFPAAALYALTLLSLLRTDRRAGIAIAALVTSAICGAALYGYAGWFQRIGYPGEALDAALTAVAVIGAIVTL